MPRRKLGQNVFLKKTGEKFTIIGKDKRGFMIEDMAGTAFFGVKGSEFKVFKKKRKII